MSQHWLNLLCLAVSVQSEEKENGSRHSFVACAVSSSFALGVKLLTELWIKRDSWNSQCLYLEVDLLSQFFSLVVLGTEVAVGGQSQEGGAHAAATRLTAEVLGPAGEKAVHGELTLPQGDLSTYTSNIQRPTRIEWTASQMKISLSVQWQWFSIWNKLDLKYRMCSSTPRAWINTDVMLESQRLILNTQCHSYMLKGKFWYF